MSADEIEEPVVSRSRASKRQGSKPGRSDSDAEGTSASSDEKGGDGRTEKKKGRIVHAPIDKLGPYGRWIRHILLESILVGTPVLVSIQKFRTPARTWAMKMISFLGTEDFYTPLVVCMLWVLESRLGRLYTLLMAIGFYVTGFLKNFLCLPRPPVDAVESLEKAYDWALPSHHSLLGVMLPFYLWFYYYLHSHMSTTFLVVLFIIVCIWSFSLMFSRLYLGVHSPADILTGGLFGVLVLSVWLQVYDLLDSWSAVPENHVWLQAFVYSILLLIVHPRCQPATLTFADTVVLMGVAVGAIIGHSRIRNYSAYLALLETMSEHASLSAIIGMSLLRMIVGGVLVFTTRIMVKYPCRTLLFLIAQFADINVYSSSIYSKTNTPESKHYSDEYLLPPIYDPKKKKNTSSRDSNEEEEEEEEEGDRQLQASRAPEPEPVPWDVDIPVKYVTYLSMMWMAVEGVPSAFHLLGLTL
ncbi:uncharacterized protein LOC144917480 [Branchiostoma floridae x Branchiostoma belcheri]